MQKTFLPINKNDMEQRGWSQCDFVFVTGDAYVDHPSFGPAIISRVLESYGFKIGIIAQPDWKDSDSITLLGEPRLGFLVSGGNMDSMVNHYTVAKKRRKTDAYTPGGVMGKRPDYATTVYCNLIRQRYKEQPIIIGGIEASLRRLAHYDYWSDKIKRSILLDSQADIIAYGMGEHSIVEIAEALDSGLNIKDITFINGTVFKANSLESVYDAIELPSYRNILDSRKEFARSFYTQYINTDPFSGKRLVEQYKEKEYVVQNPPAKPLTQAEMDRIYSLPYMREYHPSYEEAGGIPATLEVKFSLTSNRGCFGGCNYCALTFHQGRILQTRSHDSIVAEATQLIWDKDFKGYIHDVGGPTANFRQTACDKQLTKGACINKQCLFPEPCKSLKVDHSDYLKLLRRLRNLPNVKKVFIRSGIRFDYLIEDKDDTFLKELCEHHISGQLKVAPEHISDNVLQKMGKPENSVYEKFKEKYKRVNERVGKNQFLVPYLMSSHPGSTLKEAVELAEYLRDLGYMPEQVQDFYPTPSTISTCMYYTGLDPRTMQEVYVPKSPHEKAMQRALIQYRNPKNYELVVEALRKADRMDLIGFDKKCLVRPRQLSKEKRFYSADNASGKGYAHSKEDTRSKNNASGKGYAHSKEDTRSKNDASGKGYAHSKEDTRSKNDASGKGYAHSKEDTRSKSNASGKGYAHSKEDTRSKNNASGKGYAHSKEDTRSKNNASGRGYTPGREDTRSKNNTRGKNSSLEKEKPQNKGINQGREKIQNKDYSGMNYSDRGKNSSRGKRVGIKNTKGKR